MVTHCQVKTPVQQYHNMARRAVTQATAVDHAEQEVIAVIGSIIGDGGRVGWSGIVYFCAVSDFLILHKFFSASQHSCGRSECTCNCTHRIAHRRWLKGIICCRNSYSMMVFNLLLHSLPCFLHACSMMWIDAGRRGNHRYLILQKFDFDTYSERRLSLLST